MSKAFSISGQILLFVMASPCLAHMSNNKAPLRSAQIGQAVPPNHPPPGFSIIAHVSIEVPSRMESPGGIPPRTTPSNSRKASYFELLFSA